MDKTKILLTLFFVTLLLGCSTKSPTGSTTEELITSNQTDNNSVVAYSFWGDGCPHCAAMKPFLDEMEKKYPSLKVKMFEVWKINKMQSCFQRWLLHMIANHKTYQHSLLGITNQLSDFLNL